MSLFVLFQISATVACLIVGWRATMVVSHMDRTKRGSRHYLHWLGFGMGYAVLALCALGSLLAVWQPQVHVGLGLWPIGSAMLILFDRRKRTKIADVDRELVRGEHASNDIQQAVVFQTFADVCPNRGPDLMGVRLCRHRNAAARICREEACPVINKQVEQKGAA